jgi:hypothetical protein
MKKVMIIIIAVVCVVLFVSAAFAEEKEGVWMFKPAVSVGYAFDTGNTHYTFTARGIGLGGVNWIKLEPPSFSGIYLGGEMPFAITDRLKLVLEGSWALSLSNQNMDEVYSYGLASRSWDLDTNNYSVTADVLLSYAFIKDFSFIKDIAVVAGCRWDYQDMSFDNAHNPVNVLSAPLDTIDFSMYTLAPVFGLTSTFKGFKAGIFGGDMSLGILAGPIVWGHVNYEETFGSEASLRTDDDLGSVGYLFKVFGEITALSGNITARTTGSLSMFAHYTKCNVKDELYVDFLSGGVVVGTQPFDFATDSDVIVVGLKAALSF